MFLSASETHNRKNVNRSVEESLAGLEVVLARAREAGLRCEGVISTSFGCPYEGHVSPERVLEIARRLHAAGAQEIGFGDTTGMANPRQVGELFALWRDDLQEAQLTAHFHNTRGQGLANVLAALEAGIDSFESSFGELGGCPVPAGATGNIASEDLVSMLEEMGIETGHRPARAARLRRARARDPRPAAGQPHARGRPGQWTGRVDGPRAGDGLGLARRVSSRAALAHRRDAVLLNRDLHLQRRRERRARGGVDHALGAADGDGGVREQLVDQSLRGRLELGGGHDAVERGRCGAPRRRRSWRRS